MEFFRKLEEIRLALNISKGYFCKELGITIRTYGNWKEKAPKKANLYLERATSLLDNSQVVLTGIREHRNSVLNRIIPAYLYNKIKSSLQELDLFHFRHIYEKSTNHIARMQSLIFIGRIGSQKARLRAQACLLSLKADWEQEKLQQKNDEVIVSVELGLSIGLTLLKYPDSYQELLNLIRDEKYFSYWKNYAQNYYGYGMNILKGIEEMLLAENEGYNIFGVLNFYVFSDSIHELQNQADTEINYLKMFTYQLSELREKGDFRKQTKMELVALIEKIEHFLSQRL